MAIEIHSDDARIDWTAAAALIAAVGWGHRDEETLRSAFARSSHKVFVTDDGALVAMGRTVDDGAYYATLVDIVVAPSHQRQGLGERVVELLRSKLVGYLMVSLTAAPEVQAFYAKMGWRKQSTAMIWPRSEAQALAHGGE